MPTSTARRSTKNAAKARLREGGTAVGTMVSEMLAEEVAYVLAAAGFDFFVVDTEHGSANTDDAAREVEIWFRGQPVLDWKRDVDGWVFE